MARTVEYGCFFMKTSVVFFRGTTHFLSNVKRYAVSSSYICRQKKSRKFMKENVKETLDFGTMEVSRLFRKLFFPTLLGMVFSAVFVITDGIFVGRGIGSDALAAVNITAPLFLINTGIGLMFGVGASVAASIALSRGRERLARAYITQSVYVGSLLLILLWGIVLCFSPQVARFFGSSERLLPLALEYMHWFLPFFVFSALLNSGMFFVRLDGSPRYAMLCNVVPALINIALDYWFIFGLGWGMMGAALATSLGYILGALMIVGYLLRPTITLRLMSLQRTRSGWRQLCRHTRTIMRLGLSSFLCEAAIATMMFVGNYVFMHYLYEDGVAGYPASEQKKEMRNGTEKSMVSPWKMLTGTSARPQVRAMTGRVVSSVVHPPAVMGASGPNQRASSGAPTSVMISRRMLLISAMVPISAPRSSEIMMPDRE